MDHQMPTNPLDPSEVLNASTDVSDTTVDGVPNPGTALTAQDSALTKAEKIERPTSFDEDAESPPQKRVKLGDKSIDHSTPSERQKGVAPIKAEYVILSLLLYPHSRDSISLWKILLRCYLGSIKFVIFVAFSCSRCIPSELTLTKIPCASARKQAKWRHARFYQSLCFG